MFHGLFMWSSVCVDKAVKPLRGKTGHLIVTISKLLPVTRHYNDLLAVRIMQKEVVRPNN